MANPDEKMERYRIIGRVNELMQAMNNTRLFDLLTTLEKEFMERQRVDGDRKNVRINCLVSVDYADADRVYKDYIEDISTSGVFIKTRERFSVGEEIMLSMSLSGNENAFRIPAEVVRTAPDGIGVKFRLASQVQEAIIESFMSEMNHSFRTKRVSRGIDV